MTFEQEPTRVPASIGDIHIELIDDPDIAVDPDINPWGNYAALFELRVIMDDGSVRTRRGDLVPHITTAQRDALIAFMASLRVQAEEQIL